MYSSCFKLLVLGLLGTTLADLPTLFEYYTSDGISAGLSDAQPYFTLNNKDITIYSGAFHYFRVPRAYWRDRLRKMKAAGLNTVETYTPWNIHEPHSTVFDFGDGGSDYEDFLHLEEFIATAQEEDLFVIIRAGPYINSEFEFGGMPSWIIRRVKTIRNAQDKWFVPYVTRWFNQLLPRLAPLQFQRGGPIILFQLENEYGSTRRNDSVYKNDLKQIFLDNGIVELLCTSDPPRNEKLGAIDGVLQTANFAGDPKEMLDWLNTLQENKPSMAMESYTGWFDHWTDNHHHMASSAYKTQLEAILDYPASVNMYMFVGSTNFGFLNGGTANSHNSSGLQLDTTSYDYDSPITEYGGYGTKYDVIREVIAARNTVSTKTVDPPEATAPIAYPSLAPDGQLLLSTVIDNFPDKLTSEDVLPMEQLDINGDSGQSFGYIVYRKTGLTLPSRSVLKLSGFVRDTVLVLVNGRLVSSAPAKKSDLDGFGFWNLYDSTLVLNADAALSDVTLDLVVENFGRNSQGVIYPKGLTDPVYVNDQQISGWEIAPLEFRRSWNEALTGWQAVSSRVATPALYHFTLNVDGVPQDTFLDMQQWNKGITIVNGFVLGRHFLLGPQQTLYLPAPFLKQGSNDIVVFEHYNAPEQLAFSATQIFTTLE